MGKKEKAPCLRFKDTNGKDYPAWEQRKFQEITQRVSTSSISSIDFPSVEYEDIEAGSGTLNKDVKVKDKNKKGIVFDKNDILFGKLRPYLMNWLLADFKGVAVGDFWVLRSQNFDPKFVYSLIQTKSFQEVANRSSGSKMPRADWNLVSNTLSFVPSQNNEQRKIGEVFSSLDKVITLHQRKLETLKKLKRTLLQKMFPKKGQLKPELRFPGFTNDWEQRKLGELAATFGYGLNAAAKSFDGRHKYIRITDIDESTRRFLCSSLTSPDIDFEEAAPYRLAEGDVLFARTGASVGKSYRYVRTDGEVYFAGFLIRFRFKDKEAAEFVFQNSLTAKFQNFIKTSSQRSGQPGINAQQFSGYQIAVPNSEERERIGSFFSRLDTAITLHQRKLETYKKLKKSLLQKMFI